MLLHNLFLVYVMWYYTLYITSEYPKWAIPFVVVYIYVYIYILLRVISTRVCQTLYSLKPTMVMARSPRHAQRLYLVFPEGIHIYIFIHIYHTKRPLPSTYVVILENSGVTDCNQSGKMCTSDSSFSCGVYPLKELLSSFLLAVSVL